MQDDATHEYTFTDVYCGGGMSSKEFTDNKTGFQSSGRATGQHPQSTHMTTISHILSSAPETGSLDTPKGADDCLAGLSFVFTGQLEHISREEVRSLVKHYGGKVTLAPSESTDYVVVGADVEPKKLASIKEHNLRVIDEHGFLNLISKLLPHDCLVPKQNKEAKSLKNANEDVSATTITRHQEDGSSFIETSDHRPQQQISKQQQIFQAHDSFPRGSQAKAFLDDFKVFTPTKFGPNTPEYEKYQNFVMSALTRLVAMQESGVSRFQEAHGKILQLERVGQIATLDLVFARNAARDAVQNAKSKIDAIRLNNEINRRAWVDKSTPLHMRKTPITIPNYDHIESHPGTIHLTTTGKAKNEDLTSRIIDNYAIDSLWPNSRIRYSKTFLAELEQAELEFEQAQRTDN